MHPENFGFARVWTERLDKFRMTEENQEYDSVRLIHDWKNYIDDVNLSIVLEKSPPNAIRSRWLQGVFKNSYFIGLSRDGIPRNLWHLALL